LARYLVQTVAVLVGDHVAAAVRSAGVA
jgi:hypothetical protein